VLTVLLLLLLLLLARRPRRRPTPSNCTRVRLPFALPFPSTHPGNGVTNTLANSGMSSSATFIFPMFV
jgi:hypothetical protein